MSLIKSKKRVADHGEVFTPEWMVDAMLDLVKEESERISSDTIESADPPPIKAGVFHQYRAFLEGR